MRGTHRQGQPHTLLRGIIPAHAGNTDTTTGRRSSCWDHPRACGEHPTTSARQRRAKGSSPRMRGTRMGRRQGHREGGIIPAHAGNTLSLTLTVSRVWDHPRACGEHIAFCGEEVIDLGSSPRMRGTPKSVRRTHRWPGIIPAHAGNTIGPSFSFGLIGDHPRACGEHRNCPSWCRWSSGSSPRMRGTLRMCVVNDVCAGIIPAHAGNTAHVWR